MNVSDCIRNRRSIRQFADTSIDHTILEDIIATSSYSPSWKNTQIVRYIAIEGLMKNKIATECTSSFSFNGKTIENAPMLIAITVIKNRCGYERDGSFTTDRKDSWQMYDAGIASQSFCLAAYEKGIGSVIIGIFDQQKAESLLNIPADRELVSLIPIGYPAETPVTPKRKTIEDLLSYQ